MTGAVQRPLPFLDVDGPLIPFGATLQQLPGGIRRICRALKSGVAEANPLLASINPDLGARLAELPLDLVWATTWMADANECIAPRNGLPELPVVVWPEPSDEDERSALHWKTRALLDWGSRMFIRLGGSPPGSGFGADPDPWR